HGPGGVLAASSRAVARPVKAARHGPRVIALVEWVLSRRDDLARADAAGERARLAVARACRRAAHKLVAVPVQAFGGGRAGRRVRLLAANVGVAGVRAHAIVVGRARGEARAVRATHVRRAQRLRARLAGTRAVALGGRGEYRARAGRGAAGRARGVKPACA